MTPSSRRFYEALVAKCVPLLVADAFVPSFTHAIPLDRYAVRAAEKETDRLPQIVAAALRRWPRLYDEVEAVRHAFIYSMGVDTSTDVATRDASLAVRRSTGVCDAAHTILGELRWRYASRFASSAVIEAG